MRVTDMIMVITNDKGTERGFLLIYPDYLERVVYEKAEDRDDIAKLVEDIVTTRGTDGDWAECYFVANKSVYARYCRDYDELRAFLMGSHDCFDSYEMDSDSCSKECLKLLEELNLAIDGKSKGESHIYERSDRKIGFGETIHTFNGQDYRVVEKYNEKNMLLLDLQTGEFLVGIDVAQYIRYPHGAEKVNPFMIEFGFGWEHGVRLSNKPSMINFERLRVQYGDLNKAGKGEYEVEIRETLASVEKIEADSVEQAVTEAERRYRDEEVVLDDSNVVDREFIPLGKSR